MSYRSTVARQPEALADTFGAAHEELESLDLAALAGGVVAVTGIGASFAAAIVGADELRRRGKRAFAVRPNELADGHSLADGVVALSHRGHSIETVAALETLAGTPRLAITNNASSPLALAADYHVRLNNGGDATPSSTGYTATLLAMGMAFDKALGETTADWSEIGNLAGKVLKTAGERMDRLNGLFANRRAIDCVGAGAALGTADGASLLIREASRIPASAYDTRHYLHGPMESMDGSTAVVVFGAGREIEMARSLDAIGCPVLLVTTDDTVTDGETMTVITVPHMENRIAQAIIDIFSAQLLAATLSDAAGLTDVKFRYKQTDTKIAGGR